MNGSLCLYLVVHVCLARECVRILSTQNLICSQSYQHNILFQQKWRYFQRKIETETFSLRKITKISESGRVCHDDITVYDNRAALTYANKYVSGFEINHGLITMLSWNDFNAGLINIYDIIICIYKDCRFHLFLLFVISWQ